MSKVIYIALTIVALFLTFAQAQTDNHSLKISIPNYVGIKIVDSAGKIAVNASVDFDFEADFTSYAVAVAAGGADLSPTAVNGFSDIQVFTTQSAYWYVRTRAVVSSGFTGGINVGDISVDPGSVSGLSRGTGFSWVNPGWSLRTNWRTIAYGFFSTMGWSSIGFNGQDYKISVQGNESVGTHSLTVYYQLVTF
ncbi:MAG: hypothetical protein KC422_12450 [Trueperaceae bacterium]|nr:hypothetical protein [Candidatus Saccharibacteria bacterium]MCA9837719.1 hypothetical protein [Trueperaceae bacterium]